MKENIYFLELRKSDEDTAVCTKSSITSAVINFGQRNNHEFCTSCHPEEWNDEGSLNLFQNSHSREILRYAQKDNCEIRVDANKQSE